MKAKHPLITTVATASLALAAVGCGVAVSHGQPAAAAKPAAETITVTPLKETQPVIVRTGGTLRITLPANATTGYDWQVVRGADGCLKQVGEPEYTAPDTTLAGAPGAVTYTFKALTTGDTVLIMKYTQPWEKDQPAAETAAFAIVVGDTTGSDDVAVTLKKTTASIALKKGQSLDIALPANPSTGYLWTTIGGQGDILLASGEGAFKADSDLIGAAGVYTLHFKARESGSEILVLGYRGPGTEGSIDAVCALRVDVD
jgi:inhibitor of cysteine peptidase